MLWFPEDQRNTATAIANVANALGRAVGFFLGPGIVHAANDLPTLLVIEIGLSALPFLCVLVYYPALPSVLPSRGAKEELHRIVDRQGSSLKMMWVEIRSLLRNRNYLFVAVAGAIQMAVYGGWSGVLPSAMSPAYSDSQAGLLGALNTFAGIGGGLLVANLSDLPALRHKLVPIVQLLSISAAAAFAVAAFSLSPLSMLSLSFPALVALCSLAGLLRGGTDPLFFEMCSETAYPETSGTAGGLLTFLYHIVLVVMLSVPASLLQSWSPAAMAGAMLVCCAIVSIAHVSYVRR